MQIMRPLLRNFPDCCKEVYHNCARFVKVYQCNITEVITIILNKEIEELSTYINMSLSTDSKLWTIYFYEAAQSLNENNHINFCDGLEK